MQGCGFSNVFNNIFTANIYIGNVGKKGNFTSHAGVLLSLMSWFQNKDVWTFLKPTIMIEHMKMMQMTYLDITQCFFQGKCLIGLIQEWAFPEKCKLGGWGHTFLKKTLDFFGIFSVHLEIPDKTKLHPSKFGKLVYVTFVRNSKAKKPRPLEISHEFFLDSLGNSTLFLINPWKFCMLFLEYLLEILYSHHPPLCLDLFWNSAISKTLY